MHECKSNYASEGLRLREECVFKAQITATTKEAYKECIKTLLLKPFWHSQITANTQRTTSGERQTMRMCRPLPLCVGIYTHTQTHTHTCTDTHTLPLVQVRTFYFALWCKTRCVAAFSPLIAGICLRYALKSTKYIILHSCKLLRMQILQPPLDAELQSKRRQKAPARARAWWSNEEANTPTAGANTEPNTCVSRRESTQLFVFFN